MMNDDKASAGDFFRHMNMSIIVKCQGRGKMNPE